MSIWLFILMIIGLLLIYLLITYLISEWFKLNYEQTEKLINIVGFIMCIIGFCLGLYFGDKLIW